MKKDIREYLFECLKIKLQKNWKGIREQFQVPKSTFEKYKSGKLFMPDKLFYSFLSSLSESEKRIVLSNIDELSDNFGAVKGGKRAYNVNFDKFEEGRKIGIMAIRKKYQMDNTSFKNFRLTPEICEFIGAFIGDGFFNVYKNKLYQIEFACDRRYDLDYYNSVIIPAIRAVVPDINPHFIRSYNRENGLRIIFYSKKLFYFLKDIFGFVPGRKAYTVYIPKKIINADENFINSTIRGIFDTDGGVFIDRRTSYRKPYPRIIFQTVSKPLYEQLFRYLSIKFNLYTRFNQKRHIYIIELYGINQVRKWMSLIGFSNSRHLSKVASVAQLV